MATPCPLLILYGSQTGNAQVCALDGLLAALLPRSRTPAAPHSPTHPHPCTQDVAERIGREAARRHFAPRVLPADAHLPAVAGLPAEPALVWVASTTGQGDPPDNMRQLWRFLLRKSLAPGSLGGLRAAVFGLGDSG